MPTPSRHDQAAGLRQMFAHARAKVVPVVSNPHVAFGGVMLERLCTAFGEHGARVLVVDAGERAGVAGEMAMVDLGQCIERLSSSVSYLAARGLPIRFVDAAGSTRAFLDLLAEAAPAADIVLVHAAATELTRLLGARRDEAAAALTEAPCPILLADDRPTSVTHAYASMKLLAGRAQLVVCDLLLAAAPQSPRAGAIAAQLGRCADSFFGAVLRDWARVDPAGDPREAPGLDLRRLVAMRFGDAPTEASLSIDRRTNERHAAHANP